MMASPAWRCWASLWTVASVGPPAGTMIQTARGALSLPMRSSSEEEPVAPSLPNCLTASALRSETTSECPSRINRRVIFAPMRPNPTIPSCMRFSLPRSHASSPDFAALRRPLPGRTAPAPRGWTLDTLLNRRVQRGESRFQIFSQVDAQRPAPAFRQNLEIPAGLCRFHHAKRVFLAGNRQLDRIVARDLQKHPRVRSTLVSLSGGMQEARPKSQAGGHVLVVANGKTQRLQALLVFRIHLDVGEDGEIVSRLDARQMSLHVSGQRFIASRRLGQFRCILLIGKQLDSSVLEDRFFRRQRSCFFVLGREIARCHFARLNIR